MGDVYRAFSTPLYRKKNKLNKAQLNPALGTLEMYRLKTDDGYTTKTPWVLENELSFLKPLVQECLDDMIYNDWKFKKDLYKIEIQNSWVMKHVKGDQSGMHWHSNSLFSGILYLQCDEKSGTLMFINKDNWCGNVLDFEFEEDNALNQDTVGLIPGEGEILIFPSRTPHMVSPSMSEHSRYCLAFNTWIRGPLGKGHEHNNSQLDL